MAFRAREVPEHDSGGQVALWAHDLHGQDDGGQVALGVVVAVRISWDHFDLIS